MPGYSYRNDPGTGMRSEFPKCNSQGQASTSPDRAFYEVAPLPAEGEGGGGGGGVGAPHHGAGVEHPHCRVKFTTHFCV